MLAGPVLVAYRALNPSTLQIPPPGIKPFRPIRTPAGKIEAAEPAVAGTCAASEPDVETVVHGLIAVRIRTDTASVSLSPSSL